MTDDHIQPGRLQVAIVPAGVWGSALAVPLADNGHDVRLWDRNPARAARRQAERLLHPDLPGAELPERAVVTVDLAAAVSGADLIILAPAASALRDVCRALRAHAQPGAIVISACKSIEPGTHLRMSEVIAAELPEWAESIVALSGPNFAHEVAARLATTTVAASGNAAAAARTQAALMTTALRVYTNEDICGVELGGALKNIIAIGAGAAIGLGLGANAQAALATRGLAEMTRLGTALGANPLTFAGLSGLGDLLLSTTGTASRNRQFGVLLGRGLTVEAALAELGMLVEGVRTVEAAYELAARRGVDMPITCALHAMLFAGKDAGTALADLMGRAPTQEPDRYVIDQ